MSEKKWNSEQLKAIESTGGNLLVSAAAGSGKTAVLVERVIRLMTTGDCTPADRFLIVTFTKLAAAEMKEKIHSALSALSINDPHNEIIQKQQICMEKSHISTIHSFCSQIVLENFNVLGIAPDSRIADENEANDLRGEALDQTLELYYSMESNETFHELCETLGGGKTDGGLCSAVLTLYGFIRSLPDYQKWLSDKISMYDPSIPVKDTVWGKIINEYSESIINKSLSDARFLLDGCKEHNGTEFIGMLNDDIAMITGLSDSISVVSWDDFCKRILNIKFTTKPKIKNCDPPFADFIADTRDINKKNLRSLQKYYKTGENDFREDIEDLLPKIECLFSLVIDFDRAYSLLKREKHLLDYSDLEQMSFSVLCDTDENGCFVPTECAKEISSRFDYILVDECQDINKVQDTIISVVSNGHNLFFVGDVKQSIYKFRQAMPELFLQKKEEWPELCGNNYPATVNLGKNYRSRDNITGAVNFIFKQLMCKKTAEMDYTDSEMLIPEASYESDSLCRNRFVLIQGDKDDDTRSEAAWVADDIQKLVNSGMMIRTDNGYRGVRYSDICILIRSAKDKGDIFTSALRGRGIDCRNSQSDYFLKRPEISAVIDVLKAIDNPLLDIPLCGAMLSEMFLFTPDELAEIRLEKKGVPFYHALKAHAEKGNEKCLNFLDFLNSMRKYASSETSDSVIERLYYHTSFPQIMRSCENGDAKAANLRLLVKYAQDRESTGCHGLSSFLRFIDRIESNGNDFAPASSTGNGENSVRVMTVHASKGLEFPVVYLCGTKHKFNLIRSDGIYLHPSLGFACSRRDPKTGLRFNTLPQEALAIKIKNSDIAEELRILYVALTRAKENLVITCTCKNPEKYLSECMTNVITPSARLDPYTVLASHSESDWILSSLLRHPSSIGYRKKINAAGDGIISDDTSWDMIFSDAESGTSQEIPVTDKVKVLPDNTIIDVLNTRKNWVYHHKDSEAIPSKVGVSSLTHGYLKNELLFTAKPSGHEISGTARGTAIHKFLQFCDFSLVSSGIDEEIERLIKKQYLTENEAAAVDKHKISMFTESRLFERMKSAEWFAREYRFIQSIPASEIGLGPAGSDDLVTVQGVADYVFRENGKYYVVDYKTDRVNSPEELKQRYRGQLDLYRKLLSRSFGVDVSGAIIWSFHFGHEIYLD